MLRRSFRFGLLVGVLGGAVAAAVKMFQGRPVSAPEPVPAPAWEPLPNAEPVVVPPKPEPSPTQEAREPRERVAIADLQESPTPPRTKAPAKKTTKAERPSPWVEPVNGQCPPTHPIKAKLSSGIFHVPGGLSYERTKPDRCYVDAAAAEADGLRPSKI